MGTGNYCATASNMKLVHWPLMGGLLHLVQRGGTGQGRSPPRPLLAVPNVTAHPSTASVAIIVLLYNGPLLCGFNLPVKGLTHHQCHHHHQCRVAGGGRCVAPTAWPRRMRWHASRVPLVNCSSPVE